MLSNVALEVQDLSIAYGKRAIVDGFTHSFRPGVHAIVGPNGSGKTSLLNCLAGITKPQAGKIMIDGIDLFDQPLLAKRKLSFMPDKPLVYPFMTGNELLKIVAGAKQHVIDDGLLQKLELLNLVKHADVTFKSMSFGTQRKFTLVAALIGDPLVMLLDEPLNGLDQQSKTEFIRLLDVYKNTRAIVVASHDRDLIEQTGAAEIHLETASLRH